MVIFFSSLQSEPSPGCKHVFFRRATSLAHAKAAVSRILDSGSYSVSGKSIFLIAVIDKNERFDDEVSPYFQWEKP